MKQTIHTAVSVIGQSCVRSIRILGALAALAAPASAADDPATRLAIEADSRRFEFEIELVATPAERRQGLMFRKSLPANYGMLFDFNQPQPVSMWMRNTYVSLDMLFIDQDGRITKIVPNTEPLSEKAISSDGPVLAVLELLGGVTRVLGIEPGDRVIHPLFAPP